MALPVFATANASAEVAAAGTHGDGLRIMQVANAPSYYNVTTPQTNLSLSISWAKPGDNGAAALPGMSALCYYYGVEQVRCYPHQRPSPFLNAPHPHLPFHFFTQIKKNQDAKQTAPHNLTPPVAPRLTACHSRGCCRSSATRASLLA